MAMNKRNKIESAGIGHLMIAGSFIPNGLSAIATKYGAGFTVARISAGVYRVTLTNGFADFVSLVPSLQLATGNLLSRQVRIGTISVANRTFEIEHLAAADTATAHPVAADISTSGTANKIHFIAVVALSDVPGAGV